MSYLAIARKYRPATFEGMVGQAHVTRTLRNALARDRVHHAFLFTGARGVGKTTAARALAKALNCEKGPTAEPCGECLSCVEIAAGRSPDLIEIDGASNNSVDNVRELRETVQYAPTHGRRKIYLIDEVHMLSKGAFNALLKTLEEPPPHVVFIFATTEANKIPDTILSRVQRFDFKRIPVAQVVDRLREIATSEGVTVDDDALRLIARAGEGSMRDAQSLLDQVISSAEGQRVSTAEVVETLGLVDRRLLLEALAGLVLGDPGRALDVIDTVYEYGHDLSQFTAELLEILRNATFLRLSPSSERHLDIPAAEVEALRELTAGVDAEVLSRAFSELLAIHDEVSRSTRPRIVLEMAVARLADVRPVHPIGGLVDRLEDLERRLRKGGAPAPVAPMRTGPRESTRPATRSAPPPPPVRETRPPAPRAVAAPPPTVAAPPAPAAPTPAIPPARTEASPTADPWARFRERISGLPNAAVLIEGTPRVEGGKIVVRVKSHRAEAQAMRLLKEPDLARVIRELWPDTPVMDVEGPQASDDDLKRDVLKDPEVRRIVDGLGVEPQHITIHPGGGAPAQPEEELE